MRRALLPLLLVLVAVPSPAGDATVTVERIFADPPLEGVVPKEIAWLPDGSAFSYIERGGTGSDATATLWLEDVESAKRTKLLDESQLKPLGEGRDAVRPVLAGYQWSPRGGALLLEGSGELFLAERASGAIRRLTTTAAEEELPFFSPDGRWVAFVRDNDLFALELATGREVRISFDGSPSHLNGRLDWVYEEELADRSAQGYAWSPDSRSLAFITLDETGVPRYPHVDATRLHPTVEEQIYPEAGDPNPVVSLTVKDLLPDATGAVVRRTVRFASPDVEYIPRFGWLPGRMGVWLEVLNRAQTRLELIRLDPAGGGATSLLVESDPAWVNIHDDLHFFPDGTFLWSSERSGYRHLYIYSADGTHARQITRGDWEVDRVQEVDEKGGWITFTATEAGPLERHLYRVRLDGSGFARMTSEHGTHVPHVAPGGRFVVDQVSRVMRPAVTRLLDAKGTTVRVVVANEHPPIEGYRLGVCELLDVPGVGGTTLHASLVKPPGFDPSRRYPVVVYVYGGPHSQTVQDGWSGRYGVFAEVMARRGFLVFSIDGRGTAGRGRDFERALLRRFGKVELEDQLAGVAWLRRQSWVDGERIGIWGASYGGFMTCYALLNAPEVFKAGVSVAGVMDWRSYDSVYTERYLKLPADNPEGYSDSSPLTGAERLVGRLLLMHGSSDDNVHWGNTLAFADRLTRAGKRYELQVYPGATHRQLRRDQRVDEFRRIEEFFERTVLRDLKEHRVPLAAGDASD